MIKMARRRNFGYKFHKIHADGGYTVTVYTNGASYQKAAENALKDAGLVIDRNARILSANDRSVSKAYGGRTKSCHVTLYDANGKEVFRTGPEVLKTADGYEVTFYVDGKSAQMLPNIIADVQ